jgi:hypothetical protein
MGCPSFADETTLGANGIDSCFRTVLQRIRDGVRSAGVSSLPYFHIGHDEPLFALSPDGVRWEGALCAGYGADVNGNGALESVEASATDRAFIAEYGRKHPGHRPELAFRTLLIRELAARIRQVRSVFGGETRILMYCDAWDPEQNGGRLRLTTYSGISLYLASDKNDGRDLADLPGLNAVEAADLRKALVVMPWQYLPKYGEQDYNTFKAFDYLKRKKYRFVFVSAMDDPRMNADYRRQIAEYLRTSRLFAGSALGYMAATWYTDSLHGWNPAKGPYEQHPAYDVLETVREIEGMQ